MYFLSKTQKKYLKVIIPVMAGVLAWAATMPRPHTPTQQEKHIAVPPQALPHGEGDMKPAWYQVFRIVPIAKEESPQSLAKLYFVEIKRQSQALRVFRLCNGTSQEMTLPTQDGSLIMIQEAITPSGDWQAIEYWNYDWGMGADFGQMPLPSEYFVDFTAPDYGGDFKTKIRFRLKITDTETILSQEFTGSVPLNQFALSAKDKQKSRISYLR